MEEKQTIYIVEDDSSIRELEMYALKNANFEVEGFEDGDGFFNAISKYISFSGTASI